MSPQPEIWIGLVELKPLDRKAYGAAGAFTNIITWARDAAEFRKKVETLASEMGFYVTEIEDAEPFAERTKRWTVDEDIEDMALQAESNPDAILYGTFHTYPFDDA